MENTKVFNNPRDNRAYVGSTLDGWERNSREIRVEVYGEEATFRVILDGKCPKKSGQIDVPTPLLAKKIVLGDLADRTLRFYRSVSIIEPVAGSSLVTKRFEVLTQYDDSYSTAHYESD